MIAAKNIRTVPLRFAAGKISLPQGSIAEIRLRTGRSACAVMTDGRLVKCSAPFSRQDIGECFLELCGNSVHSFAREISEGYITLPGGHRVGFCGTAVEQGGRLSTLKDISSLNIRFAREVRGCAEELCARAFSGGLCSLIVCGKPLSGKTTVLRDIARILGDTRRVAVVDTRGEIAGVYGGVPALDIGENTDVLNGYSRGEGIMCAQPGGHYMRRDRRRRGGDTSVHELRREADSLRPRREHLRAYEPPGASGTAPAV